MLQAAGTAERDSVFRQPREKADISKTFYLIFQSKK